MRTILLFFLVLFYACGGPADRNGNTAQTNTATSEAHGSAPKTTGVLAGPPFVLQGCYEMIVRRDTAVLSLQVQDTIVTGTLRYDWHEKDGNVGMIKGALRDSLIVADYTFESEGLMSVREVIFKIADTTLLQGFGELDNRNGKIMFRNPAQLQYMNENPFLKVPCL